MSRIIHMALSIRGAIANGAYKKEMVGNCKDAATGRLLTSDEILQCLQEHLKQGHEVIPYSQCDNWDWKKGCQGHAHTALEKAVEERDEYREQHDLMREQWAETKRIMARLNRAVERERRKAGALPVLEEQA